jgi:hypothetical protein
LRTFPLRSSTLELIHFGSILKLGVGLGCHLSRGKARGQLDDHSAASGAMDTVNNTDISQTHVLFTDGHYPVDTIRRITKWCNLVI